MDSNQKNTDNYQGIANRSEKIINLDLDEVEKIEKKQY